MAASHYEVLGIHQEATAAEVRSAYRRLVLQHHPDRSADPRSKEIFLRVAAAYETLGDPERRRHYDLLLAMRSNDRKAADAAAQARQRPRTASGERRAPNQAADLSRLTLMFSRGQRAEAETLALRIVEASPDCAMACAILGDIYRGQAKFEAAARYYAMAVQADPRNAEYVSRHKDVLNRIRAAAGATAPPPTRPSAGPVPVRQAPLPSAGPLWLSAAVPVLGAAFFHIVPEGPLAADFAAVSTWTLGLVVVLFVSGVIAGMGMALGNLIGRFGPSPALAILPVALVSFWAAAVAYVIAALLFRASNAAATRLIAAVAGLTILSAMAASLSPSILPLQALLWGGNLVYLGAAAGWLFGDSLRRSV